MITVHTNLDTDIDTGTNISITAYIADIKDKNMPNQFLVHWNVHQRNGVRQVGRKVNIN